MKSFKIMMILLVSIFLLFENAKAEDIYQYYSLHNISQGVYYCSSTPNAQSSYGLCYSPTPYIYTDSLIGVRQQYDIFSTPKRICHKETGTCSLPSIWNPGGSVDPYSLFRIFIPPGTVSFFVDLYMPRDAWVAAVARLGKPPEASSFQSYFDVPVSTKGSIIEDYRDTDIFVKNGGGHSSITANARNSTTGISGDWLYVKILNYGGGDITNIKYGTNILTSILKNWWDTMTDQQWTNLENGIFIPVGATYNNCTLNTSPPQYCPNGYGTNASCLTTCKDYITCPSSTPICNKPKETGSAWCEQDYCAQTQQTCPQCPTVNCSQCSASTCNSPPCQTCQTCPVCQTCPTCPTLSCSQCNAAECKSPACPTPTFTTPADSATSVFGGSGSVIEIPITISNIGIFTDKKFPIATVSGKKVVPSLTFSNLSTGRYNMYAAILQNGVLYVGIKDITGNIVFVPWQKEYPAISYETRESSGITSSFIVTFYPFFKSSLTISDYKDVHLYVGIAPENDFAKYQAAHITFE